jgi:branched-subunit amino acid aminotransferase/4-amino-4-deoxychorismate lyase
LNGTYLPLAEARVSPLDRAFLFGDAVYEVLPLYSSRPFRLREHLDRLNRSLAGIRMPALLVACRLGGAVPRTGVPQFRELMGISICK